MTRQSPARASAGMHAVDGILIAPAPRDFADEAFMAFKQGILAAVHGSSLRGVIIDVSRVELLDASMFAILAGTARMAGLLGARAVFVGFQPGVVSALIDMDVPCEDIESAPTLEDGLLMLRTQRPAEADPEPEEGSDPEDGTEGTPQAGAGGEAKSCDGHAS